MPEDGEERYIFLGAKIPKILMEALEKYLQVDTQATKSEFVRNAIREKIERETPWIMKEIRAEAEEA